MGSLDHLHPGYRHNAELSDTERIRWIRTERWLGVPQSVAVVEHLEKLLQYPKRPRMPCLLVYGRSGMGKTMAIQKFCHDHPKLFNDFEGSSSMPVVAFQMPKEPLDADFYDQLLRAIGIAFIPGKNHREAGRLSLRMLEDLGTRVLIIDEMNNVLSGTSRQQR